MLFSIFLEYLLSRISQLAHQESIEFLSIYTKAAAYGHEVQGFVQVHFIFLQKPGELGIDLFSYGHEFKCFVCPNFLHVSENAKILMRNIHFFRHFFIFFMHSVQFL